MGKRIRSQQKGRGRKYRSPRHRYKKKPEYPKGGAEVLDIFHAPGRTSPLALLKDSEGKKNFLPPRGIKTGDKLDDKKIKIGNTLPLSEIPDGVPIYNIETTPGSGGKLARSSGASAFILGRGKKIIVHLPSGKTKDLNPESRATIGVVAGGSRVDQPFMKAGTKHIFMMAKGKAYPTTSGVSMNPLDHPFGGKTKPGKPKTVSRNAPPGAKVGSFRARITGRKKGRKR